MDIRVGNADLIAPGPIPFTRDDVALRKVNPGVSEDQIKDLIQKNGRDEILFKTDGGELYLAAAGQLDLGLLRGFPKAGEKVTAGEIEGTIVFANNELNKPHLVGAIGMGAALAAPFAGIAFGFYKLHTATGALEALAAGLGLPFNTIIGSAAVGIPGAGALFGSDIVNSVRSDRADVTLDQLTTAVDP
ncbi:hypothetical protein ACFL59_06280 [Planctomycetota bacterium]